MSSDAYELKVRLPDLEPTSVRAALGADGQKIEVIGERKIEGCTCQPSTVKEIALPYRPRTEDIDVEVDKEGVLALRLARHAKTESATELKVSVSPPAVAAKAEPEPPEAPTTRPLRFVPHESAKETATPAAPSLDEKEKNLTDKFRSAALAAAAVQAEPSGSSSREAAAAMAEGAGDASPAADATADGPTPP